MFPALCWMLDIDNGHTQTIFLALLHSAYGTQSFLKFCTFKMVLWILAVKSVKNNYYQSLSKFAQLRSFDILAPYKLAYYYYYFFFISL